MKKALLTIILSCIILIGIDAQKKGILQPVTVSDLSAGDKAFTDNMFMRFGATFSANTFKLSFDENDEFNGISSAYLSRVGFVIGWAHYVEKDGEAVSNYSLNGVLMTPTEGFSNLAVGATISIYNISVGVGYDFVGETPFKKNIFGMINAQILF